MIIGKEIEIIGSKGKRNVLALFDTISTYSIIKKSIAEALEILIPLPQPKKLLIANGEKRCEHFQMNFWFLIFQMML